MRELVLCLAIMTPLLTLSEALMFDEEEVFIEELYEEQQSEDQNLEE